MPPKSILKKPPSSSTAKPAAQSKEDRYREIALHHAYLIQDRKDVEAAIVSAIETLIDFPTDAASTSANPSASDVDEFSKLIYPFTPNDYDELIEERRIDGRCGYIFCSNAPKTTPGGKMKIVGGMSANAKIMQRSKAESWCSNICAKRALFVKVQLMETPAWERRAGSAMAELEILTEAMEQNAADQNGLDVEQDDLESKMKELELERGDEKKPARATGMVLDSIVEKNTVKAPRAPQRQDGAMDEIIEGYLPRGKDSKDQENELGERELKI